MSYMKSSEQIATVVRVLTVMDGNDVHHVKVLTTPYDLSECFFEGINRVSERVYGSADAARLLRETDYVRYSTTQGTNAIVERRGL